MIVETLPLTISLIQSGIVPMPAIAADQADDRESFVPRGVGEFQVRLVAAGAVEDAAMTRRI